MWMRQGAICNNSLLLLAVPLLPCALANSCYLQYESCARAAQKQISGPYRDVDIGLDVVIAATQAQHQGGEAEGCVGPSSRGQQCEAPLFVQNLKLRVVAVLNHQIRL